MQRSVLRGPPELVSAKGVFGIAKRRFPPEFLQRVTTLAMPVFEIGLPDRFGVVTFWCCSELYRLGLNSFVLPSPVQSPVHNPVQSPVQSPVSRGPLGAGQFISEPLAGDLLADNDNRTAATRREIGGLEISGTSAGLRGNFLDDSW